MTTTPENDTLRLDDRVAVVTGYVNLDLTPEDLRDHLAELRDEAGYQIFTAGWESAEYHSGVILKAATKSLSLATSSGKTE